MGSYFISGDIGAIARASFDPVSVPAGGRTGVASMLTTGATTGVASGVVPAIGVASIGASSGGIVIAASGSVESVLASFASLEHAIAIMLIATMILMRLIIFFITKKTFLSVPGIFPVQIAMVRLPKLKVKTLFRYQELDCPGLGRGSSARRMKKAKNENMNPAKPHPMALRPFLSAITPHRIAKKIHNIMKNSMIYSFVMCQRHG